VFDDFAKNAIQIKLDNEETFDLDLKGMLRVINQRIEVLYDREHTIGHAYFMKLKDDPSISTLCSIFENRVIPLLAEYFFEDWEKIRMVLGDNRKGNHENYQFVTVEEKKNFIDLFGADKANVDFLEEQKTYSRNHGALSESESYIGIYNIELFNEILSKKLKNDSTTVDEKKAS